MPEKNPTRYFASFNESCTDALKKLYDQVAPVEFISKFFKLV
jgi:hypothetical protein